MVNNAQDANYPLQIDWIFQEWTPLL